MSNEADERAIAATAIKNYVRIVEGTDENLDVSASSEAVDQAMTKTYIVEQTEQFRVRAASEEQALAFVVDGSEDHVEWLACTNRQVL
jgi:hypothetical protein